MFFYQLYYIFYEFQNYFFFNSNRKCLINKEIFFIAKLLFFQGSFFTFISLQLNVINFVIIHY
jgi:hypothetical protein